MSNNIIVYKKLKKIVFSIYTDGAYTDTEYDLILSLDLMGNIVSVLNNNEGISFVNKNIFIIDDNLISFEYRNDIAHVMFELLNISSFYISSQSMLSLHDNDMATGVVINYYGKNK